MAYAMIVNLQFGICSYGLFRLFRRYGNEGQVRGVVPFAAPGINEKGADKVPLRCACANGRYRFDTTPMRVERFQPECGG